MIRAGIVVTGTEVLTGRISDSNGPWVSERLAERGVEVAHILVVADRPDDLEAALRFMAGEGMDLIVTTGGLGPTADDLTAEVVARFAGRELVLDEGMEEKIAEILRGFAQPLPLRPGGADGGQPQAGDGPRGGDDDRSGRNRAGAGRARRRAGRGRTAGPPARAAADVAAGARDRAGARVLERATPLRGYTMRMFGMPESEIAKSLREIEADRVESARSRSPPACGRARSRSTFATATGSGGRDEVREGLRGATRARSSASTARRSTTRWRRCWWASAGRWRSHAPAVCWRRE